MSLDYRQNTTVHLNDEHLTVIACETTYEDGHTDAHVTLFLGPGTVTAHGSWDQLAAFAAAITDAVADGRARAVPLSDAAAVRLIDDVFDLTHEWTVEAPEDDEDEIPEADTEDEFPREDDPYERLNNAPLRGWKAHSYSGGVHEYVGPVSP